MLGLRVRIVIFVLLVAVVGFVSASHAYISADADSAALLGHGTAKRCALRQPRELLRAVYREGD